MGLPKTNCSPSASREQGRLPWSMSIRLKILRHSGQIQVMTVMSKVDGQLYEYACHEGNYGMVNILRGERMAEARGVNRSEGPREPGKCHQLLVKKASGS